MVSGWVKVLNSHAGEVAAELNTVSLSVFESRSRTLYIIPLSVCSSRKECFNVLFHNAVINWLYSINNVRHNSHKSLCSIPRVASAIEDECIDITEVGKVISVIEVLRDKRVKPDA